MAELGQQIYQFEGLFLEFNRATLTLARTRAVVEAACKLYGLSPPRVTHHSGKAMSYTQFNDKDDPAKGAVISFNYSDKNRAIALHETAHFILGVLRPLVTEHHSTEFLDLYAYLLLKFEILPRCALIAALRSVGLRDVVPSRMAPKKLCGCEPWNLGAKELRKL